MNCGSTASMKMMPLGFVALTRKPRSTSSRGVPPSDDCAAASSIGVAGARHCWMPSQTRYAAPNHFTASNA